jgi:hypothetical protein
MTTIDFPIVASIVALLLLGLAALGWGTDSRPDFSDGRVR